MRERLRSQNSGQASGDEILAMLRSGNEFGLFLLYHRCRPSITSYVLRNSGDTDDAEDMLQEACVIIWERIRAGLYTNEAKLETFALAVVKNIWLRRLSRKRSERNTTIDPDTTPAGDAGPLEDLVQEERSEIVRRALESMGDPCRSLLILYYYEELDMKEIARRMGFANAATAKSKKYQCKKMLQLRVGVAEGVKP